ncbi:LLM class flavin-dependent oxidoreductase [Novosphingobium mangrovi (ex Huang et al. 2023)]|uniref:LLM class flavin-dependent oxidoreductase n=1 Tax=Novosphingobium mangrovi (ex Huang et al. 2023) TaxID=2976432 RepID=A0ABT2I6K4_9SPHN|nr:LLM class flavin-dependent oxidoreductase [Novosphingobium mangrovi (ex Huang et al. 2023)]MCT2400450.1 LLM class flavin-dependent oxidoreductase [Novosphingobium mangrovi (ex Huang et al. 2023)]
MTQFQPTPFDIPSDAGGKDLGIFLPIANGGWILSKNKPELDGSYAYNRQCAVLAEDVGFDFIMSMSKFRGYGGETHHWDSSLDPVVLMAALAEVTSKVKCWTTVHTILQNPAVVAKMMATLDQVSGGRSGLNVVTGSYKGEFSQMGAWPEGVDHDGRYDLAKEWITAIKRLWKEDSVSMDGKYFQLDDCESWPKPEKRPFLVCAGSSKKGMRFTSEEMDAIFLSGADPEELAEASRAAKADAAELGRYVRTYSMMTVVFGDTDEEAEATAKHYAEGFDEDALHGMMRAYGFLDAEIGKENAFTKKARSSFMSAHVTGCSQTVTDRLTKLLEVSGTDGLMLIFPDYLTGIPKFGREVLPVLRERFPGKVKVGSHG